MIKLLAKRRFGPFFLTRFFGAFNDNLFKQALIVFMTVTVASIDTVNMLNNLAAFLFIVPFFCFPRLPDNWLSGRDYHHDHGRLWFHDRKYTAVVRVVVFHGGAVGVLRVRQVRYFASAFA